MVIAERFRSQPQKPFGKSVRWRTYSLLQFDLRLNVYKGDVNKGSFERINLSTDFYRLYLFVKLLKDQTSVSVSTELSVFRHALGF